MNTALKTFSTPPVATDSQQDFLVLDGSASMMGSWHQSLAAIDAFIAGCKAQGVKSQVTLSIFDSTDLDYQARSCALDAWVPLSQEPVGAHWGGTPLYDTIALIGRKLRDLNPPRAAITFVTDGDEAGSRHTTLEQARSILQWMRAKGWQVTFIGCDFDNSRLARKLGIANHNAVGVAKALLTDAAKNLATKRAKYAQTGESMDFTDAEKTQFGGYLARPQ